MEHLASNIVTHQTKYCAGSGLPKGRRQADGSRGHGSMPTWFGAGTVTVGLVMVVSSFPSPSVSRKK